jgi:hypothetical protein
LKKIYQEYRTRSLGELSKFDTRVEVFRNNGQQIKLSMQKLLAQYSERNKFIEEYFLAVFESLSEELKEKQEKITWKYQKNAK